MVKNLLGVIRLHQFRVDEKRRALGELLGEVANLEQQSKNLERQISDEQDIANSAPDTFGMFYGTYATAAVGKRAEISSEINEFEEKIAVAQEEMRVEYKELKVFEITQEARDDEAELDLARAEQSVLDEIGQESHRRRQDTDQS